MKKSFFYLLAFSLLFLSWGCAPTYPKEKITSDIVNKCQKEYGLPVIAKMVDNTIGVYMALDNLLDQNFAITKEASEKIGNAALTIQRAVLSTNAKVEFYNLTVVDKKLPSIEFKLTVYVKDIKRALTLDISRGEYYERIYRDLKLNLVNLVTPETFSVEPIKLPDFLAEQIAGRLKLNFEKNKTLKVTDTYGEFKEGHFLFTLDIEDKSGENPGYLSRKENRELLREAFKIIDFVLCRYGFNDFKEVKLRSVAGKEVLRIKKEDFPNVRKNKILIDNYIS